MLVVSHHAGCLHPADCGTQCSNTAVKLALVLHKM